MPILRRLFLLCLPFVLALSAGAADLTLEAHLIWASNETSDPRYHAAPDDLSGKLHMIYKWTSYFEITNQIRSIPARESRDFRMSDKCVLKIKNLGDSRIEVNCIGQGKQVSKGIHTITPGQWVILAGNAKNNTAWFISLRPVDASLATNKN